MDMEPLRGSDGYRCQNILRIWNRYAVLVDTYITTYFGFETMSFSRPRSGRISVAIKTTVTPRPRSGRISISYYDNLSYIKTTRFLAQFLNIAEQIFKKEVNN